METLTRNEPNLIKNNRNLLEVGRTPVSDFTENARDALLFSLVQSPLSGAAQLIDKSIGTELLPKVQFMNSPHQTEFGSSAWAGQVIGGTVGTALPFLAMHRLIGPGAAAKLEATNSYGLGRAALPHLGKSMLAGAAYTAILQPINEKEEPDFWQARLRNGATGGLAALTLTATSIGLKSTRIQALNHDIIAGAISGVPAGLVSANAHSLLAGKGFATATENTQSMATFALGGAFLGGSNMVQEYMKPTTGMRGVRTLDDMKKLADSTRTPDFEVRTAALLAEEAAGRPYYAAPGPKNKQYELVLESLKDSQMPQAKKEMIARATQDLVMGYEALAEVKSDYIVTMYGSARTTPEQFEYHRARFAAGEMGKKGMAVMTGGGCDIKHDKSIMAAGNKGVLEGGGESLGASVELPFEAAANRYQTTKMIFQEYFTRKQVLREGNAFVVEIGGLGSLDEAFELLCHLQCKKAPDAPVYFVGKGTYGPVHRALENMVGQGLMSAKDLKLYKIIEDPRVMIKELEAHRASLRAQQAGTLTIGVPSTEGRLVVPNAPAPGR